jgi:hypothetical protein
VRIYNYTHKNKHKYIIYYVFMNYRTVWSFGQEKLVVYIRNLQYPI